MRVFEDPIFYVLDGMIGFLPKIIDGLFARQTDLMGMEVPMGYIYSAALVILSMYFVMKIQTKAADYRMMKENTQGIVEVKKKDIAQIKATKPVDTTSKLTHFFGLFELRLKYMDACKAPDEDLKKLKAGYMKMLVKKLGAKYPNVKFKLTDKVFFISTDFLIFDPFILDISKMYKIFVELDNQKSIKTELLVSFGCGNDNNNFEYIEKVLHKVNGLNYVNKVIALDKLIDKYKSMRGTQFEFISLGLSRIEMDNFRDVDVDLYYLKKI